MATNDISSGMADCTHWNACVRVFLESQTLSHANIEEVNSAGTLTLPTGTPPHSLSPQAPLHTHYPHRHPSTLTIPTGTPPHSLSPQAPLHTHYPHRHPSTLTIPTGTPPHSLMHADTLPIANGNVLSHTNHIKDTYHEYPLLVI